MATRTCRKGQRGIALLVALHLGGAVAPVQAAALVSSAPGERGASAPIEREASTPIEVAGPTTPSEAKPTTVDAADASAGDPSPAEARTVEGPQPPATDVGPRGEGAPATSLPTRFDPGDAPRQVAIGLGPTAAGSKEEQAILRDLEATLKSSAAPAMTVRRLRSGASEPRSICRQRRDDLVVVVDYLPEREAPVLLPYDCSLDQALSIRGVAAAREPELGPVLWDEHAELVRRGAQERRAPVIAPRTRRFLIAGGAIVALGVALGFIISATLRPDTVVVTVSP